MMMKNTNQLRILFYSHQGEVLRIININNMLGTLVSAANLSNCQGSDFDLDLDLHVVMIKDTSRLEFVLNLDSLRQSKIDFLYLESISLQELIRAPGQSLSLKSNRGDLILDGLDPANSSPSSHSSISDKKIRLSFNSVNLSPQKYSDLAFMLLFFFLLILGVNIVQQRVPSKEKVNTEKTVDAILKNQQNRPRVEIHTFDFVQGQADDVDHFWDESSTDEIKEQHQLHRLLGRSLLQQLQGIEGSLSRLEKQESQQRTKYKNMEGVTDLHLVDSRAQLQDHLSQNISQLEEHALQILRSDSSRKQKNESPKMNFGPAKNSHSIDINADVLSGGDTAGQAAAHLIREVIQKNRGQIAYCYEKGLQLFPQLEGRLFVRFEIFNKGQVRRAWIQNSSLKSQLVEKCVLEKIRNWRFPFLTDKSSDSSSVLVSKAFVLKKMQ